MTYIPASSFLNNTRSYGVSILAKNDTGSFFEDSQTSGLIPSSILQGIGKTVISFSGYNNTSDGPTEYSINVDDEVIRTSNIFMYCDDASRIAQRWWVANIISITRTIDNYVINFDTVGNGADFSPPISSSITYSSDTGWTTLVSVVDTGGVSATGTWAALQAQTVSGGLQFRVLARSDAVIDSSLSKLDFTIFGG